MAALDGEGTSSRRRRQGVGAVKRHAPRRHTRPMTAVLTGLLLLTGCGDDRDAPRGAPAASSSVEAVRQDAGPVRARFPELGDFQDVRWQASVLGGTDSRVPGPTDVRMSGVVRLTPEKADYLRTAYRWEDAPAAPEVLGGVARRLPSGASWRISDEFGESLRNSAAMHVDFARNVVVFDARNPARVVP
jgi:hypothetical protein